MARVDTDTFRFCAENQMCVCRNVWLVLICFISQGEERWFCFAKPENHLKRRSCEIDSFRVGERQRTISNAEVSLPLPHWVLIKSKVTSIPHSHSPWLGIRNDWGYTAFMKITLRINRIYIRLIRGIINNEVDKCFPKHSQG